MFLLCVYRTLLCFQVVHLGHLVFNVIFQMFLVSRKGWLPMLTFYWLKILIIYVFLLQLMFFSWFCQETMEGRNLEDLIVFPWLILTTDRWMELTQLKLPTCLQMIFIPPWWSGTSMYIRSTQILLGICWALNAGRENNTLEWQGYGALP